MKSLILFILFATNAFCLELDACLGKAAHHGANGETIPSDCKTFVMASPIRKDFTDTSVSALNNILLVGDEFIAGPETGLTNIRQLEVSSEEQRVYVLNQNGEDFSVLSFPATYGGNISPRKKLITIEMKRASSFAIDSNKIYVISKEQGWIKSFNLHADPDGRRPANSTKVLDQVEIEPLQAKGLAVSSSNVYALLGDRVEVYGKDLAASSVAVIDGAGQLLDATKIEYLENEKALVASNQEGPIIAFIKDAEGVYVPRP